MLKYLLTLSMAIGAWMLSAQTMSKEILVAYTSQWEGERFEDGRPKVPIELLDRMKAVTIEEAWGVLRGEGYHNQFEGGWKTINDLPVCGRALTALYMPNRPDVSEEVKAQGERDGRVGSSNSWPIDMLTEGDVYVADGFGKVVDGTLIGDNLGNAIYANSGRGVVFNASSRDLEGLSEIEGFNAFVRDWHPSFLTEVMLAGLNVPIRMGSAVVLPGDVVLAKREGVIFIPAHLAEKVVVTSEVVRLRDMFGISRLKEGKYTPGQIDSRWSDEIERDFSGWLREHINDLPVPADEIQKILEKRTW
ncbi:MAG: RraA family protein [Saprospiraceae bacterium]|nr:RraA family protein [Saprospiraceae bacterium]